MLIRRCKVKSRQKLRFSLHHVLIHAVKAVFVRRTFSATMIEIHHLLTTQKLENQPYLQNSDVRLEFKITVWREDAQRSCLC
ncbi:hypothetical protein QL285_033142 [Trifolium repens]|nr:hypothetical protein QL285_033142 [Trifolium repens]